MDEQDDQITRMTQIQEKLLEEKENYQQNSQVQQNLINNLQNNLAVVYNNVKNTNIPPLQQMQNIIQECSVQQNLQSSIKSEQNNITNVQMDKQLQNQNNQSSFHSYDNEISSHYNDPGVLQQQQDMAQILNQNKQSSSPEQIQQPQQNNNSNINSVQKKQRIRLGNSDKQVMFIRFMEGNGAVQKCKLCNKLVNEKKLQQHLLQYHKTPFDDFLAGIKNQKVVSTNMQQKEPLSQECTHEEQQSDDVPDSSTELTIQCISATASLYYTSDDSDYSCKICGQQFTKSLECETTLMRHLFSEHNVDVVYKQQQTNYENEQKYTNMSALQRIKIKYFDLLNNKKYICNICMREKFSQGVDEYTGSELLSHLQLEHKNEFQIYQGMLHNFEQ